MGTLKIIGFLIVTAALGAWLMRVWGDRDRHQSLIRPIVLALISILLYTALQSAVGIIEPGERGVVVRFGKTTDTILQEGPYAVIPLVDAVEMMTVQTQAFSSEAAAASFDLQNVKTTVTLNYNLDPSRVNWVYQNLRRDWQMRIITPVTQEGVKSVTARYKADELIQKRPEVKEKIEQYITQKLQQHGVLVDQMSITDFRFSDAFTHAIEAKVTAVQDALKAENELQRVKFEAEQKVARAHAEAEALKAQKEQITPQLIQLRQIEMLREKWNGQMPSVVLGSGGTVPFIDIAKLAPTSPAK